MSPVTPSTTAPVTLGQVTTQVGDLPVMEFLLFGTFVIVLAILLYIQSKRDRFDLRWLILDETTKHPSIHKIGQALALIVSTWGFVYQMTHGAFTVDYLLVYMGVWAGSTALNAYLSKKLGTPAKEEEKPDPPQ